MSSTRRSGRQAVTGEPEIFGEGHALEDPFGMDPMQLTPAPAAVLEAAAAAVLSTGVDTDMEDPAEQEYVPEAIADQDDDGAERYSFGEEGDSDDDDEFSNALEALEYEVDDEDEDEDGEDDGEDDEDDDEVVVTGIGGVRATLSGGGIMSLLFGRNRAMLAAGEALNGLPRLPLSLKPLQGDLAAAINNGSRGFDVGQANPIWGCLDSSCDPIHTPSTSTANALAMHQQAGAFSRVFPPPPPAAAEPGSSAHNAGGSSSGGRGSKAARRQQDNPQSPEQSGGSSDRQLRGAGSILGGAISSIMQQAAQGVSTRASSRRRPAAAEPAGDLQAAGAAAAAAPEAAAAQAGSSSSSSACLGSGQAAINSACMLFKREVALGQQYGFSRTQQVHMGCRALPLFPRKVRDSMHSRAYIGQYSASGDFFIAAYQDRRVRLYDTTRNWALRKDVTTRMTRWTITDTTMSPDQRLLVYASISPVAFVVNVGSSYDVVESQANITEVHEPLAFDGRYAEGADARRGRRGVGSDSDEEYDGGIGIWSIAWSPQGGQLIAGTNGNAVYVYDIESKRCLTRLSNHQDDVNAVAYLSDHDPHLIVSGSDDSFVRVWDMRDRSGTIRQAQGVLVGHTEGVTHVCTKGDGYHLISNCKDQTIKLWDTRAAVSQSQAAASHRNRPRIPRWDYRWEEYPAAGFAVQHPDDVSLMTYRGHAVLQTLIRSYFSPAHSTGQRYIYAGNAEGDILVWDVVSGKLVSKMQFHESLVRDCSWHPYEPELTTASWDGRIVSWGVQPPDKPLSRRSYRD